MDAVTWAPSKRVAYGEAFESERASMVYYTKKDLGDFFFFRNAVFFLFFHVCSTHNSHVPRLCTFGKVYKWERRHQNALSGLTLQVLLAPPALSKKKKKKGDTDLVKWRDAITEV